MIAAAILVAAVIIVVGYGYFNSNPSILATTSTSTTSTTSIYAYLNASKPTDVSASCTFINYSKTYQLVTIHCSAKGDKYTTGWNFTESSTGAYALTNDSSFSNRTFFIYPDQSTPNIAIFLTVDEGQHGAYVAKSYCIAAYEYRLINNNFLSINC